MVKQKKDVVSTLETVQKNDGLLPRPYFNTWLFITKRAQSLSTQIYRRKIYTFREGDKDMFDKIRENIIGGPFIVFTRKAIVDEFFNRQ